MDLANLSTKAPSNEGAFMTLRHPVTDEPLFCDKVGDAPPVAMGLKLLGADSDKVRGFSKKLTNMRLAKRGRKAGATITAEELEADAIEMLVVSTVEVTIQHGGEMLKSDAETFRSLYKNFPWIREQVDAFVGDVANFLKPTPDA